jgi:hypothetical protein
MELANTTVKILLIIISFVSVGFAMNADLIYTNINSQNSLLLNGSQNTPVNSFSVDSHAINNNPVYKKTAIPDNLPVSQISADIRSLKSNPAYQNTFIPDPWGFGYFIHPSALWSGKPIFGHNYWLSVTPYPYIDQTVSEDQEKETPCLYSSDNGLIFENASGVKNPFACLNPIKGYDKNAYGSDPDIVYCPVTDQMFCYYVVGNIVGETTIEDPKVRIYNGREMSQEYNCTGIRGISPAVIYDQKSRNFYMWIIDINSDQKDKDQEDQLVRYESTDGINFTKKTIMDLSELYECPWHIDVCYNQYDEKYYMLITFLGRPGLWLATADSPTGKFSLYQETPVLYIDDVSSSTDKISFIYRSTGLFKEKSNVLDLWLSVQIKNGGLWRIIHTTAKKNKYVWSHSEN